ncbi:TnpV protein [Ruminococcus sp.]|uniref:TnpV protein n=1 Tax=Ruminococcus sp. TaxID=41978 RepID=UPI0038908682
MKSHHKILYYNLLTSCKLHDHLADINEEATEMYEQLVERLAKAENITEQLKAENQMLWVQRMNSIRIRVTEIVINELIFV